MSNLSGDRISYLEAKQESADTAMEKIEKTLESLDEKVGKIEMKMEKSMSFFGGIAFTFSFLGAVLSVLFGTLLKKLGLM